MLSRNLLFVILISFFYASAASGQSNDARSDQPTISSCTDYGLIEAAKNQWTTLDRIAPLTNQRTQRKGENDPYPHPSNWQWLVYQGHVSGNWEIYRQHPSSDLFNVVRDQLTSDGAIDVRPRANYDASKVVFTSNRSGNDDVYSMGIDGSLVTRLTDNGAIDTMASWSPDGAKILFVSTRTGNADLFLMDVNGTNQQQITSSAADELFPSWSPDGSQIAWVELQGSERRLWIMNRDGSSAHSILGPTHLLQNPAWSHDMATLAFDYDSEDGDTFNEVGLVNVDGTNFHKAEVSNTSDIDLWVSGWDLLTKSVNLTYVSWHCPGGSLYATYDIGNTGVEGQSFPLRWSTNQDGALPDQKSQDIWPPTTSISGLPNPARTEFLNPTWRGFDIGPSGIWGVNIEARTDDSDWLPWSIYIPRNKKLYFRSQGIDDAGNVEAWSDSTTGDAETEPFDWMVTGSVVDNRGVSLPQLAVSIFPTCQANHDRY